MEKKIKYVQRICTVYTDTDTHTILFLQNFESPGYESQTISYAPH